MPFISFLQTSTGTAPSASGMAGMLSTFLPMIAIFAIFYFFLIRPQNKKQKETEKMIAALKKGDKVVTIGGIHGVISSTKEKTVVVKVDDNTKIEFNRTAIATVVTDKPADVKEEKSKKDKKEAEETSTEDSAETK
ncbi:MAG: preprotein translocase subunit YajC [Treponema sp.]|jgi:preprotein translocase subunit YajC|nr:preprotein translocase subunit YajC [Treponema sp.]MBQ1180563.1 preprotein translocase subunit YajC [Treponema sp.]MBQ1971752.1 preprotein translocase subunit YajC [Treponema sp.]MBQ5876841.1 preprotein translocase subunit YajC [Treponema sp.]